MAHENEISMPMSEGRVLPTIYLREKDLPEIRGWKVGGEYYLIIKVEQVSIGTNLNLETGSAPDKKQLNAEFKIKSVKAASLKPITTTQLEREEFAAVQSEALGNSYDSEGG